MKDIIDPISCLMIHHGLRLLWLYAGNNRVDNCKKMKQNGNLSPAIPKTCQHFIHTTVVTCMCKDGYLCIHYLALGRKVELRYWTNSNSTLNYALTTLY